MSDAPPRTGPPADPLIGARVGEYHIQGVLGRGGMGVVYQAEDTALGIPVALKSITAGMTTDVSFVRRFRTEARAMARVASPHIVRVMALRETEHGLFIVMEYVDGGSLHDRMAGGPMAWEDLWPLLRQMLLGLEAAHTVGVVHRDIKPRNVLLTTDDTVKLTDFGLARLQNDGDATRTQAVAGTLAYMSPEQVRSLPTLDHRSDLFSLGLTAYEALVGRLPFDRDGGDFTMMRAIVEDAFPAPTEFSDRVPPEVAAALMRALEKDPDQRYASAAEMREALAGVGDDAAPTRTRVPAPPPVVPPPKPAPAEAVSGALPPVVTVRRPSSAILGGIAVGVLALLALGWWLTRSTTLTLVPLDGVSYFVDGEPVVGEIDVSAGTVEVLCVANGASATTEVEVGRGTARRVACAMPDQAVDVSAYWDGTAEPASVLVDGTQAVPLPTRLALGTGHHTLRVISTRLDTTLTVDVLPTFDPAPPPPQTVAVQAGTAPPPPTDGPVAQSGPIAQPVPQQQQPQQQTQSQPPQVQPPSNPPPSSGPAPARMGTVDVAMDAGVTLSLDGSSMSSGSRELRPGTYTARCQAGPLSETTRVTVTAGQRSALRCYAPSRVVRVTTTGADGAWMSVVVDGQPGAQTPTQVTLPVGRHTIIVRRRGYEVVGQDMMTVDVPPRFSPDPLPPVPLAFEVRAAN